MVDSMKYSSECNRDIYMYEFISEVLREYFEQVDHGNLCAIDDAVDNAILTKLVCDTPNVREYIESCCRNINRFRKLCEAFVHGYEKCNGRHISNPYPFYIIFQVLGIYSSNNENIKSREVYELSFLRFIFAKITSEVSIQLQEFVEFICDWSKYEEFVAPLLLTIYEPKFIYANVIASLQEISCSMKEEILIILSDKAMNKVKEINKYNTHENHIIEKKTNVEHNHRKDDESKRCIDKQKGEYSQQELSETVNSNNHVSEGKVISSNEIDIHEITLDAQAVQTHVNATSPALLDTAAENSGTMQRENGTKSKCNYIVVLPPAEVREMALTLPSIQKKTKKMVCNDAFLLEVQEKYCEHANEHAECSSICKVSSKNLDAIQNLTYTAKNDRKHNNSSYNDHKMENVNAFYKGTGTTAKENDNDKMFMQVEKNQIYEQKSRGNASPVMKLTTKCNKKDEIIEIPHTKATLLKLYALIEEEKRVNEKKLEEKQYRIIDKDQTCKTKRSDQANGNPFLDECEREEWEKYEEEEEQKEYEYEEDTAAVAELARQKAEREIELYKRHLEELEAAERRAEAQRIAQQQKREEFSKAKEEWKKQIGKLSEEHEADLAAQRSFVTKLRSQIKEQVKQAEAKVELHNYTIAQEVKSETERLLAIANIEKEKEAKKRMTIIQEIKELRKRLREQRKMNAKIKNKRYGNKKNDRSIHSHLRNNNNNNNSNNKNKKFKYCYSESEEDSDNYCINDDDDGTTSERSSISNSSSKFQEYNMSELELELNRVRAENNWLLQERKNNINAQRNTNHEMRKILSDTCNNELKRRRQLRLERQEMAKARVQRAMEWKKSMLQTRLVAMHSKLLKRQESKRQEYEQSKVDAKEKHKLYHNYECKKNKLEQRRWAEYEKSKINNYKAHLCTEMAQTEEYLWEIKQQQQKQ